MEKRNRTQRMEQEPQHVIPLLCQTEAVGLPLLLLLLPPQLALQPLKRRSLHQQWLLPEAKKGKLNGSVSLLDDESQQEFKALAMEKRNLVDIKTKKEALAYEREVLNYRLEKLSKLKSIKKDYPDLTHDQIKQLFPELKDVVDIVWSLVAKSRYPILKVHQAFQNVSS